MVPDAKYFYLTGGTAPEEFYFGHRKSYDLDLFTGESRFVLPFSRSVEQSLGEVCKLTVTRRFETFVEFECATLDERVRVQFAFDSPFRFQPPVETEFGMRVNDYDDFIVDKLLAFFGRTEPRDAIDVFIILQRENLWALTERAQQKDQGFDLYWLAVAFQKAQSLPNDLRHFPVEMIVDIDVAAMKALFARYATDTMKRIHER